MFADQTKVNPDLLDVFQCYRLSLTYLKKGTEEMLFGNIMKPEEGSFEPIKLDTYRNRTYSLTTFKV